MKVCINYVYHSDHIEIFKRKKEGFEKMEERHMALWYVQENVYPSEAEAKHRFEYLQKHGETPYASTFCSRFSELDLNNYLTALDN